MKKFNQENKDNILKIIEKIDGYGDQKAELSKKIDQSIEEITTIIAKELINWKPLKDEMAVCYYPGYDAWYVWFIEEQYGSYRFKETPSWEPRIQSYYRQSIEDSGGGDMIIMPLELFQEINFTLQIRILNKYEEISR